MSDYAAPVKDMRFVLDTVCGLDSLQKIDAFSEATGDMVDAILEEAGKLASGSIAPLNIRGDSEGSVLENGVVRAPDGFKEAYAKYVEGGWNGLSMAEEHGGQGLPLALAMAVQEAVASACMSFSLCPMLTQGALEAIAAHASDELKAAYLPKMVLGEWTGAMNLTEPQAGSDVGAVKAKAEAVGDGSWRVKGTKIFITWGDHEMAENIIHLVLARTPDAAPGTRGISMFLVPKYLPSADGTPGERNDLKCVSVEHKLGIHASPTCVMSFGDNDGAVGWLVGDEGKGMRNMFTMMNHARINVGLQGVAIGERAYQQALSFARERVQGKALGTPESAGEGPHAIIHHADVRRMLMRMKALNEATRALTYLNASAVDRSHHHADEAVRWTWQGLADLLTPVTKAFATDTGTEVASLGIQIHGGMGFIEETGAAQHWRDSRIAPIYEGTNGIQAMDLVGRKIGIDGGSHWRLFLREIGTFTESLPERNHKDDDLEVVRVSLENAVVALHDAAEWMQKEGAADPQAAGAGAVSFTRMFGLVVGGYLLAKQAVEADKRLAAGDDDTFLRNKRATARFYAEHIMPETVSLHASATAGADAVFAIDEAALG